MVRKKDADMEQLVPPRFSWICIVMFLFHHTNKGFQGKSDVLEPNRQQFTQSGSRLISPLSVQILRPSLPRCVAVRSAHISGLDHHVLLSTLFQAASGARPVGVDVSNQRGFKRRYGLTVAIVVIKDCQLLVWMFRKATPSPPPRRRQEAAIDPIRVAPSRGSRVAI
ncbi:hypothetical protein CIHG_00790 [Coccidioides immitis H538.4]|uniref:Uncharacterized protein n=3 Tax=Coccidioides immitis TaxID=5501 RepID=A0A0J8QL32_COCIT|nr:hypothetical protein CIRG_03208 [Coccidioides immitis RMSCC 2394]KMU73104.1 hypothetical protein CISG_03365 [Coccidioides immitis RMSCC 3703]KMU83008.1 hypothetical protein CIHG_00790 [Coccidioides immitis H538.4]